jgi:hypothetical protein
MIAMTTAAAASAAEIWTAAQIRDDLLASTWRLPATEEYRNRIIFCEKTMIRAQKKNYSFLALLHSAPMLS